MNKMERPCRVEHCSHFNDVFSWRMNAIEWVWRSLFKDVCLERHIFLWDVLKIWDWLVRTKWNVSTRSPTRFTVRIKTKADPFLRTSLTPYWRWRERVLLRRTYGTRPAWLLLEFEPLGSLCKHQSRYNQKWHLLVRSRLRDDTSDVVRICTCCLVTTSGTYAHTCDSI